MKQLNTKCTIDNNFPINTDGILGRDFLTAYRCNIDYDIYAVIFNKN